MIRSSIICFWIRLRTISVGAAIWLLTAATTLAPAPVDEAMVERAIVGAEWLVEQALKEPERLVRASRETDLVDWMLASSGAYGSEYDAFAEHLVSIGYEDRIFAVSDWLQEIAKVLTAAEARKREGELRSATELQAEITIMSAVPLDQNGERERDQLIEELILSSVPEAAKVAASNMQQRVLVLLEIFARETKR